MVLFMKVKITVTGAIIIIAAILVSCQIQPQRVQTDLTAQGQTISDDDSKKANDFSLYDTKGELHQLADYKGEKVYIKFWASWCPICLAGLDEINDLSQGKNDFKVLTIVTPNYKGEKDSDSFIKWFNGVEEGDHLTVLLDEDGKIAQAFGVRGYPTSVYIGSEGDLAKVSPGHANNDVIQQTFENIQ